jgi:hypothetical protein
MVSQRTTDRNGNHTGRECPTKNGDQSNYAFLLLLITSLVKPKYRQGCSASNEYLARKTGTTPRQVQRIIRVLEGYRRVKGTKPAPFEWRGPRLIRQVGWKVKNGKRLRILDTRLSRLAPEDCLHDTPEYEAWGDINDSPESDQGAENCMARGDTDVMARGDTDVAQRCTK